MASSELLEGKQLITTSEGTISPTTWHLNCSYLLLVLSNLSVDLKSDTEDESVMYGK
jgi:hypothetical protein